LVSVKRRDFIKFTASFEQIKRVFYLFVSL
jgi:hypothetical protein